MNQKKADFAIILNGSIFKEINECYEKELDELRSGAHKLHTEMGENYHNVFQCNENIKLVEEKTFGDIIIDDNHIVMRWDMGGCEVEFYYEQYWDIMELTIDPKNSEKAVAEIVKAFEKFYDRKFTYRFIKESKPYRDEKGSHERICCCLEIFE